MNIIPNPNQPATDRGYPSDTSVRKERIVSVSKNWGLPSHIDSKKLVQDPRRTDHYIYPSKDGDPSHDEVYHMPTDFAASRDDEDEEDAKEAFAHVRSSAAGREAESILAKAREEANRIIAQAEADAQDLRNSSSWSNANEDENEGSNPPTKSEPDAAGNVVNPRRSRPSPSST